jgi:hypothetical protein
MKFYSKRKRNIVISKNLKNVDVILRNVDVIYQKKKNYVCTGHIEYQNIHIHRAQKNTNTQIKPAIYCFKNQ